MGCICSKSSAVEDNNESISKKLQSSSTRTSELNVLRLSSSKRVEGGVDVKVKASLNEKKSNGSVHLYDDQNGRKKKIEKTEFTVIDHPGLGRVPKAIEGEQVAAGWPAWLSSVAGDAIKGWIPRSADTFERLHKIGQGTYSTVYKARDVTNQKIVALKKVRFDNLDPESVKFMAREIHILRKLDHPNIIKLEGLITSETSRSLYLVFEYMEHDLTGLVSNPSIKFSEPQVEQLHRIFKLCGSPSEDYWLKLRLPHSTVFKPPHHYRRCVADTFKEYSSTALKLIETLLSVDPSQRGTAAAALKSEFFTSEPLPCDPSSLPKYPPSKEIDAKMRDEATRRQGAVGEREKKVGSAARQEKGPRAVVSTKDNADLGASIQQVKHHSISKNRSELSYPHREHVSGNQGFPHRQSDVKETENNLSGHFYRRPSHSGPLVPGSGWPRGVKEVDNGPPVSNRVNLAKLSGLVASRTLLSEDQEPKPVPFLHRKPIEVRRSVEATNGSESRRRRDKKRIVDHSQIVNRRVPTEKSTPDGHGSSGNKIYMSGPLLASNNMDQMLKDHDRKIQEFSRRARGEKVRTQRK
ncbi:hypothetical protein TSUD_61020 [Trifolium subterraneum]|uniref:Protein kinase domain-containing protein n=1 Tax=Trifolium subterraneum TaxID=3900 RepID=A0A2Z6NB03_TRISU|nr:hypothetical protein TSUD_61020 [Trifolium subterraneum]